MGRITLSHLAELKTELQIIADPVKAAYLPNYFKVHHGGYGEGDQFIGVTVPAQRRLVRKYYLFLSLEELAQLLAENVHEYRLTALLVLVRKFEVAKTFQERQAIVKFYLEQTQFINNWDLVDASADKILGAYLIDKDRTLLQQRARSTNMWEQRIAIIATFTFIRQGQFEDTLKIAAILLTHPHDLIHKAVGWMLREIGKRDFNAEYLFLKQYYPIMPRTMLRYAIEKFEPEQRLAFLKGTIA